MVPSPAWQDRSQSAPRPKKPEEAAPKATPESLMGRFEEEQELLRRHVRILKVVRENEPVGIIKLAELTGYPQHKVRYSLRILEQEGLIEPSSLGAKTTSQVQQFVPRLGKLVEALQRSIDELRTTVK